MAALNFYVQSQDKNNLPTQPPTQPPLEAVSGLWPEAWKGSKSEQLYRCRSETEDLDLTSQTPNTNGDNRPVTCIARLWEEAQMCDMVLRPVANHKEACEACESQRMAGLCAC